MSHQSLGFTHTLVAGADLSTHHQKFVTVNASGLAVLPAAGAFCVGVTLDKAQNGASCPIQNLGIAQVIIGTGGLVAGNKVSADASGQAIVATTGHFVQGVCLVGGTAGKIAAVLLTPNVTAVV